MFRIASIDWGSRFQALGDALKSPRRALTQIGAIMSGRSRAAFKDQGRPAGTWAARAVPNVPGILRDFHSGSPEPKQRRFDARPAVVDEGTLARAVTFEIVNDKRVEVGVHGPAGAYVDKQHFGGESATEPNTPEFKAWLWRWLKGPGQEWKSALGYLLNKNRLGPETWNVRARPIFVLLPQDVVDIAEMTGVEIVAEVNA